jgi:hypothetical protein
MPHSAGSSFADEYLSEFETKLKIFRMFIRGIGVID